ncbi:type II toxin-antitoxin system RelE/ParE family toxin [Magnetovibrio sp. PR-2]|uniref:type II toxin-antitoxin system RelE/ParE family toxin n=1 Tax=Magnetovibrio sp. PR-2 TaxID=3120356 RepID=UPI002FCE63E6
MPNFSISEFAQDQIDAIALNIFSNNPGAVDPFLIEFKAAFALRAGMPRMGPVRPELDGAPRALLYETYVALYDIYTDPDDGGEGIEIVAVFDQREDIEGKFSR